MPDDSLTKQRIIWHGYSIGLQVARVKSMRVGLLADLHANNSALKGVLRDVEAHPLPIDEWWLLGDMLGRCAEPIDVIKTFYTMPVRAWVMGNHDHAVIYQDSMADDDYFAVTRHHRELRDTPLNGTPSMLAWFQARNVRFEQKEIGGMFFQLVHGCLGNQDALATGLGSGSYLWNWDSKIIQQQAEELEKRFPNQRAVLLYGHTHLSFFAGRMRGQPFWTPLPICYEIAYPLTDFDYYLINPGSTSLSRNSYGKPPAFDYAILDSGEHPGDNGKTSILFRRIHSNRIFEHTTEVMTRNGFPQSLIIQVGGIANNRLFDRWLEYYQELPRNPDTGQPRGWEPKIDKIAFT